MQSYLSDSSDLQIYHDGSYTNIKNANSNLIIENAAGNIHIKPRTGEQGVIIKTDEILELYHDNVKKFESTCHW